MEKILVSFSGGETSAFMAQWIKRHQSDSELIFVFANTGQENEETLEFVDWCDKKFNLNLVWVEAVVHHNQRKGCTHKIVDFESASRNGEPFEEVIKKYGIPNRVYIHCTRETKLNPIKSYAKSVFGNDYITAVGIRSDEMDRINSKHKEFKLWYPLLSDMPMTKQKINFFWSQQERRLNLKGYQGNCKTCYKKSDKKLLQIAKENPGAFDFTLRMEEKYSYYIPTSRVNSSYQLPILFYRGNKTSKQILEESQLFNESVVDDSFYDESCDIYSHCEDQQLDLFNQNF